jgi:hypothetical protein
MSELNTEDEINGNQMEIEEHPKSKTQPKYNLILKESSRTRRNKNKKQINQDDIIKK